MYVHECETVVPDLGKILESHNIAKLPPCGEEQPDGIAQISNRRWAENLIKNRVSWANEKRQNGLRFWANGGNMWSKIVILPFSAHIVGTTLPQLYSLFVILPSNGGFSPAAVVDLPGWENQFGDKSPPPSWGDRDPRGGGGHVREKENGR